MSFKSVFMTKNSLIWLIVSSVLIIVLLAANIVAGILYDLLGAVMPGGPERAVYAEGVEPIYTTTYKNKKEVFKAAQDFNVELAREGMILMKNSNNALPIYTPQSPVGKKTTAKTKVSVFGKNSANISFGGSGSGGFGGDNAVSLYSGLESAGYELNPALKSFYGSESRSGKGRAGNPSLTYGGTGGGEQTLYTGETQQSSYDKTVKDSYANYKAAAFVVFTRIGGENWDIPRSMSGAPGANDDSDHFLQLDKNELDLLDAVIDADFDKIVIIINSGSAMQLDFLNDPSYGDEIDAVVWMGFPGMNGATALGEILCGKVNPSGRTPDTYAADYKKDPTWNNFGEYQYKLGSAAQQYFFVHYEESVYTGYKYYETRGFTDGENWYEQNVVYPFGHGLSYTNFTWEITNKSSIEGKTIAKDQKYTVSVKVTNKGTTAGKEVVQLYGYAPYIDGGIEKSYKTLLDFKKTALIAPEGSDTVTLTFDPYYLASYDYKDQNANGFKGFELDAGTGYKLFISKNAHDDFGSVQFSVGSGGIKYDQDSEYGKKAENRYTDQAGYFNSDTQLSTLLSQSDWGGTWPTVPTDSDFVVDQAFVNAMKDEKHNNPTNFSKVDMPQTKQNNGLTLRDLLFDADGKPYQTKDGLPYIDYNDDAWEDLLDQAVVSEMITLYDKAAYQTKAVDSIGLPRTNCSDGPIGWKSFMSGDSAVLYDTCAYVAQVVIAATFNQELVEDLGEMIGNEGIIGNYRGDTMPYSGWYAPGVNIHRSPFGGRNFEYYSEDGVLSGKMAAATIRGAQSKGVFCFVKHFALNEQETRRSINGSASWVTEQAMREIFLRPFEIAVKEGGTRAVMTSFNRIGTRWAGGDYRLLTSILRDEWGFKGTVLCDFNDGTPYMHARQMAYAGGDLNLATRVDSWCNPSSPADVYILRQCTKNVAYTIGNSNAMNGEIVGYKLPYWTIALIVVDCLFVVGLGAWGFFAIRKALKTAKANLAK